jgi:hypothetical protein
MNSLRRIRSPVSAGRNARVNGTRITNVGRFDLLDDTT